jgi:putative glutamine amidotransferase
VTHRRTAGPRRARPRIGITCDVRVEARTLAFVFEPYVRRVEEAGGVPLAIAPLADPAPLPELLEALDGVLIVGGEDLDPRLYGEEPLGTHAPLPAWRERFDLAFARALLDSDLPVLGVCYGSQLLAVVSGGALWQHIPTQVGTAVSHAGKYPNLPRHPVDVAEGTRLREILGAPRVEVNSAHHQAPKRLGAGLREAAAAPDGVLEAFEGTGERFLVGVQWHPELEESDAGRRLFAALVDAARRRSEALAAP